MFVQKKKNPTGLAMNETINNDELKVSYKKLFLKRIFWAIFCSLIIENFSFSQNSIIKVIKGTIKTEGAAFQNGTLNQNDIILTEGARIITKENSEAVIKLANLGEVILEEETSLIVSKLCEAENSKEIIFYVQKGEIKVSVRELMSDEIFKIVTAGAKCQIQGTTFSVAVDENVTEIHVIHESLLVFDLSDAEYLLLEGQTKIFGNPELPNSAIIVPVDGSSVNHLSHIEGTAIGNPTVSSVKISIQDLSLGLPYWWDGYIWVVRKTWLEVKGTTNWKYPSPYWMDKHKYKIQSYATDEDGTTESMEDEATFVYDVSK
jgi:hypothetical protein